MNQPLTPPSPTAPVAVIGMACLFPQAPDMQAFWNNILNGVDAVGDPSVPWDAGRYLDSGRIKTASGGYLKDLYRFDPREFGIMPNSLDGGEPDQFLALRVARDALRDAGYFRDDYDHRDTGIILGHSTYLHRGQGTLVQNHIVVDQTIDVLRAALPELDDAAIAEVRTMLRKKLPQSNADTAPGLVPNVMTGRIANRLNLRGPNYLVDAACSSSLLAVSAAMDELRAGRSQLMLAGGVNASLPAEVSVIFSQLGALSGRGKVRPFEEGSDGTLLGEGLGVVVLKRLSDALADGDRIYSVLREVGQASDGRGHGLLAPSVDGETLAIQRAYRSSGIDPATIGLIEAHGTGIPLGDKTEISALRNVFGERRGAQGSIAFGSVKSMISHCIPAAGIAGLIKSSLALHHRVLPPTLCAKVNPELGIDKTPLFINTEAMPWLAPQGQPRRAGIDSFGFGGINAHAIVEQAPADAVRPDTLSSWPAELCVFAAPTAAELVERLRSVAAAIAQHPEWRLADIAATLQSQAGEGEHRLALVAKDVAGLVKAMSTATGKLEAASASSRWSTRTGAHYSAVPLGGQLAFLFPGEGSQYMGMLGDLAMLFGEVREWLDFWRGLYPSEPGQARTDIVFPPAMDVSESRRGELDSRLHDMDVGSEAVFVGGQAMHSLLRSFGVVPDVMLGHSSGESAALAASGAIAAGDRNRLAEFIRELNQVYQKVLAEGKIPVGALLAVGAMPAERIHALMAEQGRGVSVAMDNCANQLIVYGTADAIAELQTTLVTAGAICMPLPFDRGYHTDDFSAVRDAFLAYYERIGVGLPAVPMYSCATADKFPGSVTAVRKLAAAQWSTTVRFRETVTRMHDDGVRCFVEVGPSGNLTAFVNDVLAGREQVAMASNQRGRPGVEHFLGVLAQLYVLRRPVDLSRMFAGRAARKLDMSLPTPAAARGVLLDNTMPMVRLDDNDRRALQAIAHAARPAVAVPPPAVAAEPQAVEPAAAPAASEEPSAAHAVMSGYFGVMREFLAQQQQVLDRWQDRTLEPEPEPVGLPADGFLHEIVEVDDQHLVSRCRLGLHTDNFLRDHILSGPVSATDPDLHGLACVPMMVSLEIMAQSCSALAGSRRLSVIENVRAFDWIALDDGEIELEVRVDRIDGHPGHFKALLSQPQGKAVSAEFLFEAKLPAGQALAALSEHRPSLWNDETLYTSGMFHGPVFQSISHIDGWDPQGIDAQLSRCALTDFFVQGHSPAMVTNPVILDAMGQLAAFWLAQYAGTDFNCFPSTIDRIEFFVDCPADLPGLRLRGRQQPVDGDPDDIAVARRWAFECVDAGEQPLIRVSGLANVFFPVQNRFYRMRLDPRSGCLGSPLPFGAEPGVALWRLEHFSEDFSGQSGGIFLRILAHACLSFEELDEWRGLTKNVRHRRQWLLGRICLKEAVRQWVLDQTGELLFPSDIIVVHDALGAPAVDGWWCDTLTPAPSVSLSHDDRLSLAAVAETGLSLGVDVEDLGVKRSPTLLFDSLTDAERLWVGQHAEADRHRATLEVWCAKEAAAKWTGQGLQGQPNHFEVTFVNTSPPVAAVSWDGAHIQVTLGHDNQSVIAVARGLYMSTREHQ